MNMPAQTDLLILLHDVARLIRLEADKRARIHGITRAQWVMLLKLARHQGLSQKDLAEMIDVEPMTIARLTDRLTRRGLVERRADPRDRRIWRLHLCPKAEPLLRIIEAQRSELATQVLGDLTDSTINNIVEGLHQMKSALLTQTGSVYPHHVPADHVAAGQGADGADSDTLYTAEAEQELV